MKHRRLGVLFSACLLLSCSVSGDPCPDNLLLVANQMEHSVLLVDPMSKQVLATVGVDINGHEVAVSPHGPAPATFPSTETHGWESTAQTEAPFTSWTCARGGPSPSSTSAKRFVRTPRTLGLTDRWYVSAELANAIYIVDTKTRALVGEIPTGASHTHMFVISPDGQRIYTANNEAGSVSVLDVQARTLVATIPISKKVQRISISPDGNVRIYAGPARARHRGHRHSNQRGRPIHFPPEDSVLFSNHTRRGLPRQFRIRKALRRRCGQWRTYKLVSRFRMFPSTHPQGEFALAPDGIHAYVRGVPGRHHRDPES